MCVSHVKLLAILVKIARVTVGFEHFWVFSGMARFGLVREKMTCIYDEKKRKKNKKNHRVFPSPVA